MAWYWWLVVFLLAPTVLGWVFAVYVGAVAGFFRLLARLLFGVSNDEAKSVERQRRHDHAEYLKQKRREAKSAQRLQRERDRRER